MEKPRVPEPSKDEYLPDVQGSHTDRKKVEPVEEGINPQNPSSMPRAEDDEETRRNSAEFHDRPPR
jgi:hypothetical protein